MLKCENCRCEDRPDDKLTQCTQLHRVCQYCMKDGCPLCASEIVYRCALCREVISMDSLTYSELGEHLQKRHGAEVLIREIPNARNKC